MHSKFPIWPTLVLTVWLLAPACRESTNTPAVMFVDQSRPEAGRLPHQHANPLLLMANIDSAGNLTLNRIAVGTVDDTAVLGQRLSTIFKDREKSSIAEREVLIEMEGTVKHEDLQRLIATLTDAGASPINVIKDTDSK